MENQMKIGFIGTGKLGMPCAEVIAKSGHDVSGYDVVECNSTLINILPTIKQAVEDRDIVFIAVPTPHDPAYDGRSPTAHLPPKDFNYDIVKEVLAEANKHMNKDQLLVLISTVLPGTVRRDFIDIITNTRFIYNPYLIAMGSVAWDMVNPEMVIIGTDDGSETGDAKIMVDFYKTIMYNNPRYVIGTWDECECIKVFYNTFISAKIGLVNMIQDVAEQQGNINVDVVTNALAESSMRIMGPQYMKAGMGDGGGCHPRDNIALRYMANELNLDYDLFDSIMNAREIQAKNLALRLVELAKVNTLDNIVIHGKSYKPNVEYLDGSYSILIGGYIEEMGYTPEYVAPLTGDIRTSEGACEMYFDIPNGSVVVDPWRNYINDKCNVIHYGNTRPK